MVSPSNPFGSFTAQTQVIRIIRGSADESNIAITIDGVCIELPGTFNGNGRATEGLVDGSDGGDSDGSTYKLLVD